MPTQQMKQQWLATGVLGLRLETYDGSLLACWTDSKVTLLSSDETF
jgi:hypothetical protein